MPPRSTAAPLWFAAALIPTIAAQLVRLNQTDPAAWFLWDYAGRVGALAVLAAIPSARAIAFRHEQLRISQWETGLKIIIGLVLVDFFLKRLADTDDQRSNPWNGTRRISRREWMAVCL
jgi:hypothetical protein